ncbi:MAG: hypothetical protein K0R99_2587 [Microbacterium sp.]|jgi:uncharacterized membrane protein|uniref:DUF2254 domain-containing protein n=1 Tax=Microbacterium sp. TaxID=51671 RepID=UPI00263501B6|nr:DUF2254 domain-containing protein [Microbacterium sp.]MDF2561141.1 hypothetical protein [Microbacterium sp.]
MTWRSRFRRRQSLLESLWAVPILGAVVGVLLGAATGILDAFVSAPLLWSYTASTASAVLTSIVGATAALTGFVVTVTVLVVQMATGTFSARVMRLWCRDPLLKATLAMMVGTLTFSFSVLSRIADDAVPDFGVTLSGALVALCLLMFIVFFDRCIRRLRPAAVAADVARTARATFAQMMDLADRSDFRWEYPSVRGEPTLVVGASRGGAIQAVDPDGLAAWARAHGSELVLPHPVGDFVHAGEPVVLVFGGDPGPRGSAELEGMVALGDERTFDQDPTFALRMMVDVANKALSPAVNDPTTAVQVLDHIGEGLGMVGQRDFRVRPIGPESNRAAAVVMVTRRWEDLVVLGLTEIREFGSTSVQVMRRLRALLEELLAIVRPEHRAALEDELRRLNTTVAETWSASVDLDRAGEADRQGLGGAMVLG